MDGWGGVCNFRYWGIVNWNLLMEKMLGVRRGEEKV